MWAVAVRAVAAAVCSVRTHPAAVEGTHGRLEPRVVGVARVVDVAAIEVLPVLEELIDEAADPVLGRLRRHLTVLIVLALGQRLDVSRSSFYWYFKSRKHLLEALLDDWEARNTRTIVAQCALPAETIGEAVGNFFKCFLNPDLFDRGLDFAVREWSRRDGAVRQRIDQADRERLAAVIQMFERHGFTPYEADVRARILYYMQLGYHALDVREPMQARCDRLAGYLKGFTGQEASDEVLATMIAYAMEQDGKQ